MKAADQIANASRATYASLEGKLSQALQPIPPRKDFVRGLGHQIKIHPPAIAAGLTDLHAVLIFLAGILSTAAVAAVAVKAILVLFGKRGKPLREN